MDSKASNLSCSKESKHIEMVPAVLNKGRIWQKYVKLSLLKRLFRKKWAILRRGAPAASRNKVIRYRRKAQSEPHVQPTPFRIIIYRPFFPPVPSRMKKAVCMFDFGCRCNRIGGSTLWQDL
ncbi:unnamed protein product (mitochondrion) [Musa hybrid cultivar]